MQSAFRRATRLLLLGGVLAGVATATHRANGGGDPPVGPAAPTTRGTETEVPRSRGGADLVGTKLPALAFDRWLNTDGNHAPAGGSVTLYRWWTNTCPFCASSLPAIEGLRQRYGPAGLRVVAVYHPKPPQEAPDETVLAAAARIGYAGAVAVDTDWSELKRLWLSTGKRDATSASFLVDRDGVIRFVHPGPDLFPSRDPDEARQDADYHDLEKAIRAVLNEIQAVPATRPAS